MIPRIIGSSTSHSGPNVAESEPRFPSSGAGCDRPAGPEAGLGGVLTVDYAAAPRPGRGGSRSAIPGGRARTGNVDAVGLIVNGQALGVRPIRNASVTRAARVGGRGPARGRGDPFGYGRRPSGPDVQDARWDEPRRLANFITSLG